jgi:cation diffusion facilitator CzcD-associated flavoprotein CzcO
MSEPDVTIAIIGAGPSGIAMAIKLQQAGFNDFTILERKDDVGGSWRDNTYPGICADSPGLAYQYSFFKNRSWSRLFPSGAEVQAYHVRAATEHGLYEHLQCGVNVTTQTWCEDSRMWRLGTADGRSVSARFLITAVGVFRDPVHKLDIPGLNTYRGTLQHTSSWDPASVHDGRRIAIIGTGASAVQIVPRLAETAALVDVYQRTPVWCLPKPDFDLRRGPARFLRAPVLAGVLNMLGLAFFDTMLRLAEWLPTALARPLLAGFDAVARSAYRRRLRRTVADPALAELLEPRFGLVVKRPILSNEFLPVFNKPGVALITETIVRVTNSGIETAAQVSREYDMIVLATGYTVFTDPAATAPGSVLGHAGADLGALWEEQGLQAYEGVSVPDFPNRWMIVGPYSWTGTGWHSVAELAADHIVRILAEANRRGAERVEVAPCAHRRYMQGVRRKGRNIKLYYTELNRGVRSYYVNRHGEAAYIRPGTYLSAMRGARRSPLDDYRYSAVASIDQGAGGSRVDRPVA